MLSADQGLSSEFLALCESQLALLTESLGANQTAVYLTQTWQPSNGTKLVPVAVYPRTDVHLLESLPEIKPNQTKLRKLLPRGEVINNQSEVLSSPQSNKEQLVLPLIYEDMVMGLLVTSREDKEWKPPELVQIEQIAQTIAIACLLDQRQSWYEQNLVDMQEIRIVEQTKLADFLHQLRNPLTALRTFGKLLLKRLIPGDENQKIVTGLLREAEHLQDLIKQFETGTRESPQLDSASQVKSSFLLPALTLEPVNLSAVVEPILLSAQTLGEAKNIQLLVELSAVLSPVQGNAQALAEVLQNLVDNALKYTPSGGKIKITTLTKPGFLGLAIHDTGYGIPHEVQERIFERHYRGVQANGDIPGTGLGLAIAKDLIEQMHGSIELISPNHCEFEDKGTTFIVWLPLSKT
ncbi:GAF domain-containing sensor histidine kinase [Gloeocapsa sp. PCC 73106]|uniref:GAF domain-containing sensor histidine kinase n=1 Tax=Gloeocapsa sp. PCC 73106 TaxID=102232 RepID=UPI0002ABCD0C|nr:GAF domain-containing sensor histidine kinase [Gloeocapsa sp. PCC 73106]ELR99005.1 signal transduction histidine kinase [Gloeocapsa sp. PCC 73106]